MAEMKKLALMLLLAANCLYPAVAAPPSKAKPSPSPTPPAATGETYYKWLNDFAHWIETHPPTPDPQ
jgi:hypothetical protein